MRVSPKTDLNSNQEWENNAFDMIKKLRDKGTDLVRVMVKVTELEAWCQSQGRPIDGEARAAYVSFVMRFEGSNE